MCLEILPKQIEAKIHTQGKKKKKSMIFTSYCIRFVSSSLYGKPREINIWKSIYAFRKSKFQRFCSRPHKSNQKIHPLRLHFAALISYSAVLELWSLKLNKCKGKVNVFHFNEQRLLWSVMMGLILNLWGLL